MMSVWQTRIEMAQRGWHTEININCSGIRLDGNLDKRALGMWAKRWHWQGAINEVCLHTHRICDIRTDYDENLIGLIADLNEVCLRAEKDFTDRVPCMGIGRDEQGRHILETNSLGTDLFNRSEKVHWPTERLLPDASSYVGGGADYLKALQDAALTGLDVRDDLNTYFGPARYARECKNRDWGYRLRLAKRSMNGEKVSYQPQEFTTRMLHEAAVQACITGSAAVMEQFFAMYAPDGPLAGETQNGLPPGFMTLSEARDAREAEMAKRLDDLGLQEDDLEP
jgi:hypothetical protein